MLPLDHEAAVRWVMGERAMKMSDHGLSFLIGWEGARSKPYDDGGPGRGNCTVGVGHLIHYGPCTQAELDQPSLSLAEINRLLRSDVARFENAVNALRVPLNQNQYDALVSFAFNCGQGAVQQFAGDISFIRRFVHDGAGNTLDALVRRREAEIQLYETPVEGRMKYTDEKLDEVIANLGQTLGKKADDQKVNDLANAIDSLPPTRNGLRFLWALAAKAWPFGP